MWVTAVYLQALDLDVELSCCLWHLMPPAHDIHGFAPCPSIHELQYPMDVVSNCEFREIQAGSNLFVGQTPRDKVY